MNKYIFVLIVCAVVFLICFLIDTLFKVIFPKSKLEKSKQVVRPPRTFSTRHGAMERRSSATARSGASGACSRAAA